ncbi:unnamed protein product [Rotaria socialis]|uniref:Uncharacterized protein n=2 Tax=Rotaria socialis TaxID=392032 RepID=A0A818GFG8_9BILA|nr:unnamed protein product [Rotaria socialis]
MYLCDMLALIGFKRIIAGLAVVTVVVIVAVVVPVVIVENLSKQTAGNYSFACYSAANTYGYLYVNTFDPSNVNVNLIAQNRGTGGNFQFYITIVLQPGSTYILVVTTYAPGVTTAFSIIASGPTSIGLLTTTTRTSITSESTIPVTATPVTTSTPIAGSSNYTSELTNSSQTFTRYGSTGTFYYQAIQINVSVTGNYSFACFSAANAYGYLYVNTFDPSNVNVNLIAQNSGTGGNFQFYITIVLQPGSTYILVVTTYAPGVTTAFSITASGPTSIGLLATTTRTSITSESTIPTITAPPAILNNTCMSAWSGSRTVLLYLSNSTAFSYTLFQYTFVATMISTTLAFALRQDPSYWCLDDISVIGNGQQIWQDGGFETSPLTQYHTYCNPNAAAASGVISATCAHSGHYSFYDGSVRYSDYLSQSFTKVVGQSYSISFWLENRGGPINSFIAIITT